MSVAVTGLGAVSSLGENANELWAAVEEGRSGITKIDRFDVAPFGVRLGAMVRSQAAYDDESQRLLGYARAAAEEALGQAGASDRSRVALVLGTCNGLFGSDIHIVSGDLARILGLGGPSLTFSTACASSAHAIGFAADLVRHGVVECAVAGGVDTLCLDVFAGFHSLGLLSPFPCAPFSTRMGTTLGEGAAFLVLERGEVAAGRTLATLMGFGLSADAYHDTGPDPSGSGMARALHAALRDAGLDPREVDYLNAHGTATAANDASEWRAIQHVFGALADELPVSSSKSFLGHAQGAAGALESVVTLMAMARDRVPQTTNYVGPRPNSPSDPVASPKPRAKHVRHAVSANAAFGGVNAALVFGRAGEAEVATSSESTNDMPDVLPSRRTSAVHRPVIVAGVGVALSEKVVSRYVPRVELRNTDASARLLSGAVAEALAKAGIRPRTKTCEEIGLFAAQSRISQDSIDAFDKSVRDRGLTHLSAPAFTRMVVNYGTGATCRLFGLKGPTATLSTADDGGLAAFVLAVDHLTWRNECDTLLAAAVDDSHDAAASLLLTARDASTEAGDQTRICIAGWALGSETTPATVRALDMAGLGRSTVRLWAEEQANGTALRPEADVPLLSGLGALASAVSAIRNGAAGPVLIATKGAAVVLKTASRTCLPN